MEKYVPPYEITNNILKLISSVSEKTGKLDVSRNYDSKPHLRRNNRIRSIHSSLAIEANSLSLGQVKDVIDGHQVTGTAREIQEVKNAYEAYALIPEFDPYSISDLKKLHGIMTKYLADDAGDFRNCEEGVFSGEQCIFMAPPARMVPSLMDDLFCWINENIDSVHPLLLSAVFHYEFVFIHPFSDGNGRMARLWHTAILAKWKPVFEFIPLESQIEKFQGGYYAAISESHIAGNSTAFIEFMLECIDRVLDEFLNEASPVPVGRSPYVDRMLHLMERGMTYSANELLGLLGIKSKETLRRNYINPAIEAGLIEMTVPDRPSSKNQRYMLTGL